MSFQKILDEEKANRINVGDRVIVNFNGAQTTLCHEAEVLYKPFATGDSWIFKDLRTDQIHYVSEGCTVSKIKTPPTEK